MARKRWEAKLLATALSGGLSGATGSPTATEPAEGRTVGKYERVSAEALFGMMGVSI